MLFRTMNDGKFLAKNPEKKLEKTWVPYAAPSLITKE